jgi:hypothetical protein
LLIALNLIRHRGDFQNRFYGLTGFKDLNLQGNLFFSRIVSETPVKVAPDTAVIVMAPEFGPFYRTPSPISFALPQRIDGINDE